MKKWIIIVCILLILILIIPFPMRMKDGGTVHYNAILYDVYDLHRIKPIDNPNENETVENEYIEGIIVEILGFKVFDSTNAPNQSDENRSEETTEHIHKLQDVSGEHASVCTECGEKMLKSEACNFVSDGCGLPKVCSICYAVSDEAPEEHDWHFSDEYSDCWSTTVTYACSKCNMQQTVHGDAALPSHRWTEEVADKKTIFTCTRCNESNAIISEIREFSYAQALEEYKIGDPGVKHENFNNPGIEIEIAGAIDAIVRAKFELTVEYDTISVAYDEASDVWRVDFWTLDMAGGGQSVYVNGNGLTCYIVYGE